MAAISQPGGRALLPRAGVTPGLVAAGMAEPVALAA
jgi:hypothetical protein